MYLFLERREGRERNINHLPLTHPQLGTKPTTRHVPWLGIEPGTFCSAGWCSLHWATLARANARHFQWGQHFFSIRSGMIYSLHHGANFHVTRRFRWFSNYRCGLLGRSLASQRSRIRFPVRAQAWVAGSVPIWGTYEKQPNNRCSSLFLPPFPSIKKWKKQNKQKTTASFCISDDKGKDSSRAPPAADRRVGRAHLWPWPGPRCCPRPAGASAAAWTCRPWWCASGRAWGRTPWCAAGCRAPAHCPSSRWHCHSFSLRFLSFPTHCRACRLRTRSLCDLLERFCFCRDSQEW